MNTYYKSLILTALSFFACATPTIFAQKISINEAVNIAQAQLISYYPKQDVTGLLAKTKQAIIQKANKSSSIEESLIQQIIDEQIIQSVINAPAVTVAKPKIAQASFDVPGYHQVPDYLARNNVFYVAIEDQGNTDECGYRCVFNAWAIQELLKKGDYITAQAINKHIENYRQNIIDEQLEIGQMIGLANAIGVANLHGGLEEYGQLTRLMSTQNRSFADFKEALARFKNKTARPNECLHFIGNIGAHWVLASVVMMHNQPTIFYLNSKNSPLTQTGTAYNFLRSLIDELR